MIGSATVRDSRFASRRGKRRHLAAALSRNDSYRALKRLNCHITTGPTGTNVNDLYVLLVF